MVYSDSFNKKVNGLHITGLMIAGAAIPISTAAQNIGAALLIISFLLTSKTWLEIKSVCMQPFAMAGIFLGVLLTMGILWSTASAADAWGFLLKMRAYYLAPVFLFIMCRGKMRSYLLLSFAAVTAISVILSCSSAWLNHPIFRAESGDWYIFRTHTYHNFFAALLGASVLSIIISKKLSKIALLILALALSLISYDILFLVTGRTGQIVYLLMIFMILILWNWRFGLTLCFILTISLAIILPKYSPAFNLGLTNAKSDFAAYTHGDSNTSVGLRLEWHKNSIRLIQEKPFFGHGTGSFKGEYERLVGTDNKALLSHNPHNDYLWLGVELGVIGALSLVALLLAAAWQGRHLKPAWRWTLYSLLLGMGVSTTANSFFTDNITGLAFVLLTCALLSGPLMERQIP